MARSFNGTSDLILETGAQEYAGSRTAYSASVWVKGAAGQLNKIVYAEALNNASGFISLGTDASAGTKVRLLESPFGGGTNLLDINSTATAFDGTWHHICYSQDASGNWVLYIDGTSDSSGALSTPKTGSASWVTQGCLKRTSNSNFFAGSIAEAANWTRQLAAGEAKSLAAGLPASHLGPNHYWPLWGVDSPEPDIGNG